MEKFVQEFPSAVPLEICERLIAKFDHYEKTPVGELKVRDKFVSDGGRSDEQRTKEANCIYLRPSLLQEHDEEFLRLVSKCVDAVYECTFAYVRSMGQINMAPLQVEQLDFMKYEKGEGFYGNHVDAGSKALHHRILSILVYLNDVEVGGETNFPLQNKKVKPEAGKVAIFPSFFSFVHGSNKTVSASKYVLVSFSSFAE